MAKESSKLVQARVSLKKAAEDLGDPDGLVRLKSAINSLLAVMSGDSPQIEKDIANKLVLACRSKVVSEVKLVLANRESHDPALFQHWDKVTDVFLTAGLDADDEFKVCKEQLATVRAAHSNAKMKPADVETLAKELQSALDTLSVHRSRLLDIMAGFRK